MEVVNTGDALLYGFKQIATALIVVLLGLFFVLVGIVSLIEAPALGVVVAMIGFAILTAGIAGLGYKIIADAVATGRSRSKGRASATKQAKKVETGSQARKVETETGGN